MECKHPENIQKGDLLDSLGCLQQISRAKISLNVMPWFKDGAHDRVFNSMLNGAVCLSDGSRYLDECLKDGEDYVKYDLADLAELPGKIRRILLQFVEFGGNVKETWPPGGRPEKIDRKDDRHDTPVRADVVRLPADPAVPARHGGERDCRQRVCQKRGDADRRCIQHGGCYNQLG